VLSCPGGAIDPGVTLISVRNSGALQPMPPNMSIHALTLSKIPQNVPIFLDYSQNVHMVP
ncbi:hypothetical protein PSY73_23785, partial [Shigella flexneri]|nr:hypothetical protein [Shigella flexneri]